MPTVRASDSLKTLFSKAESAFSAKNYKKAIDLLNEILERQPRNRRAQALMKENMLPSKTIRQLQLKYSKSRKKFRSRERG